MKSTFILRPATPPVALMYLTAALHAVDRALEQAGLERVVDVGDDRDADLVLRHPDVGRTVLGRRHPRMQAHR